MKNLILAILSLFFLITHVNAVPLQKQVDLVIQKDDNKQAMQAANQLRNYLVSIYPDYRFSIVNRANSNHYTVILNIEENNSGEGFQIHLVNDHRIEIQAGSVKGLFNASYALLEQLGYGFYLSFDAKPFPKKVLNFKDWELQDSPLQSERIIFNWHNFLSGCTGWNYEEWCSWIDQSAKMRYNTIMVHAYGNNPMFSFEFNGIEKPIGYLNTSISGRDWGAQHVNDVRRLPGGKVFSSPVLGSSAALVPENQRGDAATRLMSRVFEHAREMAMKINFAIDVDTWSSNPSNIIQTLPKSCRIHLKDQDIVNPDTPEGYQYYKAQIQSLMNNYPQLTTITLFIRNGRSLWNDITPDQIPESLSRDWIQLLSKQPELAQYNHAPSLFLTAKVINAFQKALKELHHEKVSIVFGSFNLDTVPFADKVLSSECPIIFLEEMPNFEQQQRKAIVNQVGKNRKLTVIFYAHHDDHRYMGRPYAPFANFNQMLQERNLSGFGLLHWTTRPLDLLLKNMNEQVWKNSENKNLASSVNDYCRTTFGSQQKPLIDYVTEWITKGPMFGRETMDHFFDPGKQMFGAKYEPIELTMAGIQTRKALLKQVDQNKLSAAGKKRLAYDFAMEEFYKMIFENQESFRNAYAMLERGSVDSARLVLQKVNPEEAVEFYSKTSGILPITMGEKALIVSMGTRWLPDFLNLKQRVGLADICYKFQATSHDELAQQPGINTYFIDAKKQWWSCLGEKELPSVTAGSFNTKEAAAFPENAHTYVKITQPLSIPLATIGKDNLAPGKYSIELKYKSAAEKPLLNLLSTSRLPLQISYQNSGNGLKTVSAVLEIKDAQKHFLEINPEKKEVLLTNLVITRN